VKFDPPGMRLPIVVALALAVTGFAAAENIDPVNDGSQYAWGENVGWLNAEPGGDGGNGVTVTDSGLSGWMWSENTGWVSFSCADTSSCGTHSFGVTNDAGTLAGFAWAENVGWISFSCANTSSCGTAAYGVTIDQVTGVFSGEAWGENIGWIRFFSSGPQPFQVQTSWSCSAPPGTLSMLVGPAVTGVDLTWPAAPGASSYDVVRGDLGALRSTSGDFSNAVTDCLSDDQVGLTYNATVDPASGQAFFYLVRPEACLAGTYDTAGSGQAAPRDGGATAAPSSCP